MTNKSWIPEILYEESDDGSSHIPFIMVPDNEIMPPLLYIFESRDTGEFEPGYDGEEVPVVQWDLHQYADMAILKSSLESSVYDIVRDSLGLEPLVVAAKKGKEITESVKKSVNSN